MMRSLAPGALATLGSRGPWARLALVAAAALGVACTPPNPSRAQASASPAVVTVAPPARVVTDTEVPSLHLPPDVTAERESLDLRIDPEMTTFSGVATLSLRLGAPRSTIWIHGEHLHVAQVTVRTATAEVPGTWQDHPQGVASIVLAQPLPAGRVTLRLVFDAPFGTALKGLYKAKQAGRSYAFTQFEAIAARQAFPCFDDPGVKIPYDVTLRVPHEAVAIANTREVERAPEPVDAGMDGERKAPPRAWDRVRYAPTLPLPSYLLAFAVGPLDVVTAPDVPPNEARPTPLPLRGIAAKGRGAEIKDALAHTGEILAVLEKYFGIAYPYDKLDILAVPDKAGAMENAGAVTFREYLLLWDEKTAPVAQRRAYAYVMAHELAHQWFGDLVTMKFWDDTWLNEAFATWMGSKAADAFRPETHAQLGQLDGAEQTMSTDSLASARAVRQPIVSTHDIENAFDGITYRKGGAVLGMFEAYLGAEPFRRGVQRYLNAHRFANASADDFLDALEQGADGASAKPVKGPFHTFLDQPGVPLVNAAARCDGGARLDVQVTRYLPLGSEASPGGTWQVPVCVRRFGGAPGATTGAEVTCGLTGDPSSSIALGPGCPTAVFPNADAQGYFRFSLDSASRAALERLGTKRLTVRERLAFGDSVRAAVARGDLPFAEAMRLASPLARDAAPPVVNVPMQLLGDARTWFAREPALRVQVEAKAASLFARSFAELGWAPRAGAAEDDDRAALRASLLAFLALEARDPKVRAEARARALAYLGYGKEGTAKDGKLHPDAIVPDLAGVALAVAGEEADAPLWDAMHAALVATEDDAVRARLLGALGAAQRKELVDRARELVFDPVLRVTEVLSPLGAQLARPETRDGALTWLEEHFDQVTARVSEHHGAKQLLALGAVFCDAEHAKEVERFFGPKAPKIDGGPRTQASTLETIRLCAARRAAQEGSARTYFGLPAGANP